MKMTAFFAFVTAFCLGLGAVLARDSAPAQKAEASSAATRNNGEQPPAPADDKKAPAPKKEVKPAEPEEEGSVMIDSKAGDAEAGEEPESRARPQSDEEAPAPGGLPVSYGLLKGTLNEGGRSILVFENEDGTITFVQVTFGRSSAAWKMISRIRRSMD